MTESDGEDYMSADFMSKLTDVKPGVNASRSQKRMLQIDFNRDAANQRNLKVPKKHELEKIRLDEGLNRPICSESKGFSLLAKMGYKPGMSLGKKREGKSEGIKEPVEIQFKLNKTGLGHDTDEKEKQEERCNLHIEEMSKRANQVEVITDDFRSRKRSTAIQKIKLADMRKIRKACQEMDLRIGKEEPDCDWFWPIYKASEMQETIMLSGNNEIRQRRLKLSAVVSEQEFNDENSFFYSNRKEAPPDTNFNDFSEEELDESLRKIVNYVRARHFYCNWCGCAYDSEEDIVANCPGITKEDHD